MSHHTIPITYGRTPARKSTSCDLIRQLQDTVRDTKPDGLARSATSMPCVRCHGSYLQIWHCNVHFGSLAKIFPMPKPLRTATSVGDSTVFRHPRRGRVALLSCASPGFALSNLLVIRGKVVKIPPSQI